MRTRAKLPTSLRTRVAITIHVFEEEKVLLCQALVNFIRRVSPYNAHVRHRIPAVHRNYNPLADPSAAERP